MKKLIFTLISIIPFVGFAQDSTKFVDFNINADIVSKYMWRGQLLNNLPSIQPTTEVSVKNFTFGFWGSAPLSLHPNHETDFYIGYANDYFEITVTDYFVMDDGLEGNTYFNYSEENTGHDLSVDLAFPGTEKIPFRALVSYNFYGADTLHSSYAELAYMFENEKLSGEIFIGGTTQEGWYGKYDGIVNLGFHLEKNITFTDKFSLPFFTQVIVNPQKENIYFVAGIRLQ